MHHHHRRPTLSACGAPAPHLIRHPASSLPLDAADALLVPFAVSQHTPLVYRLHP